MVKPGFSPVKHGKTRFVPLVFLRHRGKSARASMDLETLSDAQSTDFTVDPTFQQLLWL